MQNYGFAFVLQGLFIFLLKIATILGAVHSFILLQVHHGNLIELGQFEGE
ncbi:MAG: hypothetical protein AAF327_09370 [Cyanobacteria bacterium P01_A01_bin.37]